MVITHINTFSHLICKTKKYVLAKKNDFSQVSTKKPTFFPFKISTTKILIQSAVGVFALGFIDAGYSGDWSRIGVISKGTEELLKAAAFLIVPFSIFFIFFLSTKEEEEED